MGLIGGTSFTDALVVFTGTADTANVIPLDYFGDTFYAIPLDTLTVNIAGVGTATLTEPAELFGIPIVIDDPDGEIPPMPSYILGRVDHPPALDSFTGMAAVASNALAGYDLTTSIGPISDIGGVGFIEDCGVGFHDPCLGTSMGLLSFTTNIVTEGGGTFKATVEEVPEPSTLLLMSGALVAFVRRSRRGGRG